MFLCCRFGPIEYKGPFVAQYVENFILRVITPLTYLPSRATLQEFLSYHEVSFAFGSFDGKLADDSQSLFLNVCVKTVANISSRSDMRVFEIYYIGIFFE